MKLQEIKCPNCGASLKYSKNVDNSITCNFCSSSFVVEEESASINNNYNVNITVNNNQQVDNQVSNKSRLSDKSKAIILRLVMYLLIVPLASFIGCKLFQYCIDSTFIDDNNWLYIVVICGLEYTCWRKFH